MNSRERLSKVSMNSRVSLLISRVIANFVSKCVNQPAAQDIYSPFILGRASDKMLERNGEIISSGK